MTGRRHDPARRVGTPPPVAGLVIAASIIGACIIGVSVMAVAGCGAVGHRPHTPTSASHTPGGPTRPVPLAPQSDEAAAPGGDDGPAPAASSPASPDAWAVAEAFARAWLRPDLPAEAWLAGVRPYAAPGYGRLLETVDPANIPATKVVGPLSVVSSSATVNVFVVPTDTGILQVRCGLHGGLPGELNGGQWLVITVDFTRSPR